MESTGVAVHGLDSDRPGGGLGLEFTFSIAVLGEPFLAIEHPDGLRVILAKREILLLPKLDGRRFSRPDFSPRVIREAGAEQAHGVLVLISILLFEGDDQIPTDLLGQLEQGRLGVQRIEEQNVKKGTAIEFGQPSEQAQSRRLM